MSRANFLRAELIERIDFSKELLLFKFSTDGSFSFRPGQFANIVIEEGGKLIERAYSIVSSPYEPFLEFFVELVPLGDLTPKLWDLKVGDTVWIRNRMAGNFTIKEKFGMKRHLMAATVTGVAPYISMIRTQRIDIKRGKLEPYQFLLLHGASRSWEFGVYKDELAEISRDGWLTYIPTVSQPWEDTDWKGETGRVEDLLRKYADHFGFDHTNAVAYACGHPQMIENVKGILMRARFPKERIKEEKYFQL